MNDILLFFYIDKGVVGVIPVESERCFMSLKHVLIVRTAFIDIALFLRVHLESSTVENSPLTSTRRGAPTPLHSSCGLKTL